MSDEVMHAEFIRGLLHLNNIPVADKLWENRWVFGKAG